MGHLCRPGAWYVPGAANRHCGASPFRRRGVGGNPCERAAAELPAREESPDSATRPGVRRGACSAAATATSTSPTAPPVTGTNLVPQTHDHNRLATLRAVPPAGAQSRQLNGAGAQLADAAGPGTALIGTARPPRSGTGLASALRASAGLRTRRHAVLNRCTSASDPPQPMITAWTAARDGRPGPASARCSVAAETSWPDCSAIVLSDRSPAQIRKFRMASISSAAVVTPRGSGRRSTPGASATASRGGRLRCARRRAAAVATAPAPGRRSSPRAKSRPASRAKSTGSDRSGRKPRQASDTAWSAASRCIC